MVDTYTKTEKWWTHGCRYIPQASRPSKLTCVNPTNEIRPVKHHETKFASLSALQGWVNRL
jgi:hypothetical protein